MKYQELRGYALQASLEHHLCNVDDLLADGKTPADILTMIEGGNSEVVIYEPYEYYETSSLVESIENMRGVNVYEFMHILTMVNGEEWATNYKQEVES